MRRIRQSGFSLLEVVIAVGVFAMAIAAVLALLPMLMRQSAVAADTLAAQQFPDAVRVELQRLARADFDALAAAIPVMTAPLDNGLAFVATRDGARLHSAVYLPPGLSTRIPEGEQYFAVEVWRFDQPPLAYDSSAAVLPLYVRVSGPYRIPGSTTPTRLEERSRVTFTLAINR